jgi:hypothetical protein
MPPATSHLKILKPGQPYRLSACHLSMQHCKLNLPLVPSQDYVLQDNKRCYNKILSDWNFRPSSNDSGRLDEHEVMIDGMRFWTSIFFF